MPRVKGSKRTVAADGTVTYPAPNDGEALLGDALGEDSVLDGEGGYIDPAAGEGIGTAGKLEPGTNPGAPRRGRPPKKKDNRVDIGGWASIIGVIHAVIAVRVPEMSLEQPEAEAIAGATVPIMARWGVPAVPEWFGEVVVLGAVLREVYGPRMIAIKLRKMTEAQKVVNPTPPEPEKSFTMEQYNV
jgi:hypothetical protein